MDLTQFITWPMAFSTIFLCLAIYAMTLIVRTIVETIWAKADANKYWTHIAVPLAPLGNGLILGLFKAFPWPEIIGHTTSSHMMFGCVCGLFSGWIFAKIKAWLNIQEKEKNEGLPAVAVANANAANAAAVVANAGVVTANAASVNAANAAAVVANANADAANSKVADVVSPGDNSENGNV